MRNKYKYFVIIFYKGNEVDEKEFNSLKKAKEAETAMYQSSTCQRFGYYYSTRIRKEIKGN
jgi:hypothetical protein